MKLEEILSRKKTLIGRGRTARVYKIEGNPESFVLKEFDPNLFARLWNGFFYKSSHPLDTEIGQLLAYQKRRMANRLAKIIDDRVEIVDARALTPNGFISPFIDGHMPLKNDMQSIYARTRKLEEVFDNIGMPVLSFSPRHLNSRRRNFKEGKNGKLYIVDYEQSVPMPDSRGNFGYDIIYFDDVGKFLIENSQRILDKLGSFQLNRLEESFELARRYQQKLDIRPRWSERLIEKFSKPLSNYELARTVERLYNEGKITPEELEAYQSGTTGENIRLARMNLLVHAAISIATPPYIWPVPLISAGARVVWTAANFGYYTLTKDYDKRRIHNWRVMAVAGLPLGFFGLPLSLIPAGAYLLSIIEENPKIGLAINDNLTREFMGKTLEEFMHALGSKPVLKHAVIGYDATYHFISKIPYVRKLPDVLLGQNTRQAHNIYLSYLMQGARS